MNARDAMQPASDLSTRFAVGIGLIAVACVAVYLGGWVFRILVAGGAAVMMVEWGDMHRLARPWSWAGAALMAVPGLLLPEQLFAAADSDPAFIDLDLFAPVWSGIAILAVLALVYGLAGRSLHAGWGFAYIGVPAFALVVLNWAWFELVFWLMAVTWATDIFAYLVGRSAGGPKLAPRISPNKTWSGLAGGVLGAAITGWLVADFFELGGPFTFAGGVMALIAQAGDLYESQVKRRAGVKDSGTILPGHGGVLDRLDGLLPVIVATLALLLMGVWNA